MSTQPKQPIGELAPSVDSLVKEIARLQQICVTMQEGKFEKDHNENLDVVLCDFSCDPCMINKIKVEKENLLFEILSAIKRDVNIPVVSGVSDISEFEM